MLIIIFCSGTSHHRKSIKDFIIPPGIKNTILIVENFEYQLPEKQGVDSTAYKSQNIRVQQNMVNTAREDNEKLEESFKKYQFTYVLSEPSKTEKSADLSDKTRFRFILKRQTESKYKIGNKGDTTYEYTYLLYIKDRFTGQDYPGIEVNARDYLKTMEAIIKKMNKQATK